MKGQTGAYISLDDYQVTICWIYILYALMGMQEEGRGGREGGYGGEEVGDFRATWWWWVLEMLVLPV